MTKSENCGSRANKSVSVITSFLGFDRNIPDHNMEKITRDFQDHNILYVFIVNHEKMACA